MCIWGVRFKLLSSNICLSLSCCGNNCRHLDCKLLWYLKRRAINWQLWTNQLNSLIKLDKINQYLPTKKKVDKTLKLWQGRSAREIEKNHLNVDINSTSINWRKDNCVLTKTSSSVRQRNLKKGSIYFVLLGLQSPLTRYENGVSWKRPSNQRNLKTSGRFDGFSVENGAVRKRWRHDNPTICLLEYSSNTNPKWPVKAVDA